MFSNPTLTPLPALPVQAERDKLTTNKTMLEALHKRLEDMKNL